MYPCFPGSVARVARAVLIAAVLLILPSFAFAQQVGIKAGANFASLTPEENENPDTSPLAGLVAGVWIRPQPTGRVSFQAEGLFSEKGMRLNSWGPGTPSVDVRVRYVEIPLLARADFGASGSTTRIFVVGGGAPAFKLSGRVHADIEGQEDSADIGDDIEPFDMGVVGRELRIVDGAYTGDPGAPVGPPVLDVWVRFRPLPDDPALHAGALAQLTGHFSIAAALRPHAGVGQDQAHRTLSTAVNAISLSLHADVRVDQWLLYHHESTFAGDGMTHSTCRVHTEDGALVASFTVDAMIRELPPRRGRDQRTAL